MRAYEDEFDDVTYVRAGLDRAHAPELPPPVRFRSPVREFVVKYGWRAYALPILVVITILGLATAQEPPKRGTVRSTAGGAAATTAAPAGTNSAAPAPAPSSDIALGSDSAGASTPVKPPRSSQLPPGAPYTFAGKGTFRVLKGTTKPVGSGQSYRYDIQVEDGIKGVDVKQFARLVDTTLADPRSWTGHGVRLQRIDHGLADFHVTLTSAKTVRSMCGYDIPVETSCYDPNTMRVVLNVARWVRGATAYLGDLHTYRLYMINHEDGHALGHDHAHQCLANGLAPVMMQQTFGLRSATTGTMCTANPWPYPKGAKDAPGPEQQDTQQNNEYYIAD